MGRSHPARTCVEGNLLCGSQLPASRIQDGTLQRHRNREVLAGKPDSPCVLFLFAWQHTIMFLWETEHVLWENKPASGRHWLSLWVCSPSILGHKEPSLNPSAKNVGEVLPTENSEYASPGCLLLTGACGFQKERNWSGRCRVLVILCESLEQTVPLVT